MRVVKQSTVRDVLVFMTDSTDHITGKTGVTLTITASKAGAAFASITPTVTERGSGWYSIALTSSHSDTLGDFALHVTASGCDPTDFVMDVQTEPDAALIWNITSEGSLTFAQVVRILLSALAGKSTGGGTTSLTFRDVADSKARISATVDSVGNRTAITRDGT